MKKPSELLARLVAIILVLFHSSAFAQDPTYGFVNIVNLTPQAKPCMITLMGIDTVPGGLKSADSTGWFNAPSGNLPLALKIEGLEDASGNVELAANQTSLIVIFLEPNPRLDKDGKPLPPKIRIKRCEPLEGKGQFSLKFMSFCPGENRFMLGKTPVTAKLFQGIDVPNWSGSGMEITTNQKPVGKTSTENDKAPYYLLVGTDNAGKYCTSVIMAEKQELAEWMKPKKTKP